MRADMKKVVTERPRGGGGVKTPKGEKRDRSRCDTEELPKREKIRAKWTHSNGGKYFTDVLGPLCRYLLKQVGRPWNKVYSEIAANLPKTNVQNRHVYTHVWQFVEKDVLVIDGVPCYRAGRVHGQPLYAGGRTEQLYVHPINGLLCRVKKRRPLRREPVMQPPVKAYPGVQYHRLNGVWYEVKVRPHPRAVPTERVSNNSIRDEVLERTYYNVDELKRVYGGYYIATSKRRLTKREIRRACLAE
jgi:hypothetical protein